MRDTKRWTLAAASFALALPAAAIAEDKPAFQGRAEAAYVKTGGNTSTDTLAAKLEASYEPSANRYYGKAFALYGKTDGDETTNKVGAEARYERALTDRLFVFAAATYLSDNFSGYDSQVTLGPGVGYEVLKTPQHHLKALASVLYAYDNFSNSADNPALDEASNTYAAAKAEGDYTWQITDSTKLREYATYRVSLEDANVYFLTSETSLEVKMADNLSLGVGYTIVYSNDPPTGSGHTDRVFQTSVIATF